MSDIVLFKLSSGEEVVGELVQRNVEPGTPEVHTLLKRARVMIPTPVGPGQMSIQMAPYVITAQDADIKLYHRCIAGEVVDVPKELEDGYLHQTSGVQIAPAGSVPKDPQIITG